MDTALTVQPVEVPQPAPEVVVALSPDEMPAAQAHLMTWCKAQIAAIRTELTEIDEHAMIAANNGWKLTSVNSAARRAKSRLRYYANVMAALEAGYLIVPNMPVELLAIRVKRHGPKWAARKGAESGWKVPSFDMPCELLPAGEGRYVDEGVPPTDISHQKRLADGTFTTVTKFMPSGEYVEPDFPIRAVKPVVLKATQRAMAHKLFDEIGMVRQDAKARGKDPIMVGRIRTGHGSSDRVATFFLAWWLNPADL
jgi:hypothetical protein